MNAQINLRLPENLIIPSEKFVREKGYSNIQELIKELLREKIFDEDRLNKDEIELVKKLENIADKKNLYGTEEELFDKLK